MRYKRFLLAMGVMIFAITSAAQIGKPKLIIGVVIDQMRWDYLYRYQERYGGEGLKRLLNKGFSCENTMIPYVPTYTAVGHTCIYTGSVPAYTGIVGNNWFDKASRAVVYCTEDSSMTTVGSNSRAGKMSPENLWVTTITDELGLSNNFKSKVIGIALKDRGSIIPAGHSANAAYWYDNGKWISSSYYMKDLPAWVNSFNAKDLAGNYMKKDWSTLLPMNQYDQSTDDDKIYENPIRGEKTVTFPHRLSAIADSFKYEAFKTTPFANSFTFEFAKAAIENESLGKNTVPDFLTVSISSTDYIGHSFGPNSIEIEDTYLRLDRDIADFLSYLDKKVGAGNYLFFLSADHGVAHIPAFLAEHRIPGGTFNEEELSKELNAMIEEKFGLKKIVMSLMNYQVYLDLPEIEKQNKDVNVVKQAVIGYLLAKPFIISAFETGRISQASLPEPQKTMMVNGYNPKRSGDIQFTFKPAWFDGGKKGTTHGLWNPYDAHIPLLWYGWNIRPGKTNRETYMTDISATLAAMLQIQAPNGCVGKVITEISK